MLEEKEFPITESGEGRFTSTSVSFKPGWRCACAAKMPCLLDNKTKALCRGGVSQGVPNELIVVTILVAIEGGLQLPNVTSLEDLRTVLNKLGSIGQDQVCSSQTRCHENPRRSGVSRKDLACCVDRSAALV